MHPSPETQNASIARAQKLGELVQDWLHGKSGSCEQAAEETIRRGFFEAEDVHFALNHIRESVHPESLQRWVQNSLPSGSEPAPKPDGAVLCLHAGNLPLVGLQDVLACILAGVLYCGKVSRKDPLLLPSLLEVLAPAFPELSLRWSTELDTFQELKAGAVLFSGSEVSVPKVLTRLSSGKMLRPDARKLIRTAHSSVAWIPAEALTIHQTLGPELAEAVFRYDGRGCRSLTIIFTNADPAIVLRLLTDAAQKLFPTRENTRLNPLLRYREAFFTAMHRQIEIHRGRLLAITQPEPHTDGLITLTPGTPADLRAFLEKHGPRIQSVYVPRRITHLEIAGRTTEPLSQAQTPPVNWRPDGVDALRWILGDDLS